MVSYTFTMPSGLAGDITRKWPSITEPNIITPAGDSYAPTSYGQAVVVDATTGQARTLNAGDTNAYGVLVRPFPIGAPGSGNSGIFGDNYALGPGTPPNQGSCDVLRFGYVNVALNTGVPAPVKGGQVYIWTAATSGNHIQGGFETVADGGSTIAPTNWFYMGAGDVNGNIEISVGLGA